MCLQALLKYDGERREVSLTADRDYAAGERILAWCGPQPNSRVRLQHIRRATFRSASFAKLSILAWCGATAQLLGAASDPKMPVEIWYRTPFLGCFTCPLALVLRVSLLIMSQHVSSDAVLIMSHMSPLLSFASDAYDWLSASQLLVNYGIVEEDNPYDKLQLTATIPHSDPLFQVSCCDAPWSGTAGAASAWANGNRHFSCIGNYTDVVLNCQVSATDDMLYNECMNSIQYVTDVFSARTG